MATFTIRDAQLAVFRQDRIRSFVDEMVAYIAREYPTHHARLGEAGTRAFVERAMDAARALRIQTQGAVGALVELRLMFGEQLERAPDRQWARKILAHKTLPDYIRVGAVQDRMSERTGGRVLVVHQEEPA
jgi:hypothetical protein